MRHQIIECIPLLEMAKVVASGFIWGFWIFVKRTAAKLLRKNHSVSADRNNPPQCLVDSVLGKHSYMKIKGKGIKLHYLEAGNERKPALLLLHGFPDGWITWYNQIPSLAVHYRVIALDLKGFGDSDKPWSRISYKLDTILEEIVSFLSSMGVSKCTLVGHDMGALLGWYMIYTYPEMIVKFVSISCPHPNIYWENIPRNTRFGKNWMDFCQLPILPELDALKNDLALINECYQHLCNNPEKAHYVDAYKYLFSRREDWTGAINYYRNLPFYRLALDHATIESDIPCLLITGKSDEFVQLESIVNSTEYLQKYYLKVIEGAGHYPHQEKPELVNQALETFLIAENRKISKKIEKPKPTGLISKLVGTVSSSVTYGTDVLSSIRKDPNQAVASMLSKSYLGRATFGEINV